MPSVKNTPCFENNGWLGPILSENEVKTIHHASLDILENGIQVKSKAAQDIFCSHGCRVDKSKDLVRIPPQVVESAIQSAPDHFLFAGRDPGKDIIIEKGCTYFALVDGAMIYHDPKTGNLRIPQQNDIRDCVRLVDALEEINIANRVMVPAGVNSETMLLYQLEATLSSTTKPIMSGTGRAKVINAAIAMAAVVAGGRKELKKRPLMSVNASPNSPLVLAADCCDTILSAVEAGLPVVSAVAAIGGASAPVTLAGMLVLHNTDVLMGIILAQLAAKGAPVMYSNYTASLDMKTGIVPYASPSLALMNRAASCMAAFYRLPLSVAGLTSDSHLPDYSAGLETAIACMGAVFAGANVINGAGFTSGFMGFSPAKLMYDCQIINMTKEITAGMEISEERLALDLIKTIGPGGNFLSTDHTLKYFREQKQYNLINHSEFETWKAEGSKDMIQRASEDATRIMADHHPEPLDPLVKSELKKIIELTEKEIAY